ncbi:MAG: ORF6N domain-containing protein, partial [Candidatus Delongbacteria bacterium]|nr:ORF6N domain-containing protein [Candidatus Delongbacteria bacterium]
MVKANEIEKLNELSLKERIFTIRGFQVIVDRDLSKLYKVETKALNQAVKRNLIRFPEHYYFQLSTTEKNELVTNCDRLSNLKHSNNPPYVFTEHGIAMLSSVLRSNTAAEISIKIVDTFVQMRKFLTTNAQIFQRLDRVELKQIETDNKFEQVFNALETHEDIPKQRIFFEGQVFDAHKFVSDLFSSVKKSIVIIDNYIDVTIIAYLSQLPKNTKVKIITKSISTKL